MSRGCAYLDRPRARVNLTRGCVVTIDRIEPNMTRDEAAVEVEYATATATQTRSRRKESAAAATGFATSASNGIALVSCPRRGAYIELGTNPGQELLVSVRPTRSGRSVVKSHHVEFSEGWQLGSADTAATVDTTAR